MYFFFLNIIVYSIDNNSNKKSEYIELQQKRKLKRSIIMTIIRVFRLLWLLLKLINNKNNKQKTLTFLF